MDNENSQEDEFISEDEDIVLGIRAPGPASLSLPPVGGVLQPLQPPTRPPSLSSSSSQQQQPQPQQQPQQYVITSHFDSVLECLDFMNMVENDDGMEKRDVIDAIRGRLHGMLSKILLNNSITSMSMMGWRLQQ